MSSSATHSWAPRASYRLWQYSNPSWSAPRKLYSRIVGHQEQHRGDLRQQQHWRDRPLLRPVSPNDDHAEARSTLLRPYDGRLFVLAAGILDADLDLHDVITHTQTGPVHRHRPCLSGPCQRVVHPETSQPLQQIHLSGLPRRWLETLLYTLQPTLARGSGLSSAMFARNERNTLRVCNSQWRLSIQAPHCAAAAAAPHIPRPWPLSTLAG
jgi:hypothetical protein